nr:MAG TPA: hypothetical protein [Caudoviricetes sp.]
METRPYVNLCQQLKLFVRKLIVRYLDLRERPCNFVGRLWDKSRRSI